MNIYITSLNAYRTI